MKIAAVNYANEPYRQAQLLNSTTALRKGKADVLYEYTPKDINADFFEQNKDILSEPTGGGLWLWKPYCLKKTLECLEEGDYMMYADAGGFYYCRPIRPLVEEMQKRNLWLLSQEVGFIEKCYTKRDAFVLMDCDTPEYTDTVQRMGGLHIMKKCAKSTAFVEDWIQYGRDKRIMDNEKNRCGLDNYEGFVAHRNDQSVFSLLCKKYQVEPFENIRQEGNFQVVYYHHTKHGKIWKIKLSEQLERNRMMKKGYDIYRTLRGKRN